jgi:hypothetical protein
VLRAGDQYTELARRWDRTGEPFSREDDVRLFAMLQQAGQLAARAVEIIFGAAGSSAAKRGTRLQRYYRDVAMYHGHIAAPSSTWSWKPPPKSGPNPRASGTRDKFWNAPLLLAREGQPSRRCAG